MSVTNRGVVDFAELLAVLNFTAGEFVSIGHQIGEGVFHTAVRTPALAVAYVDNLPAAADVWFGVNPTTGPARTDARRGTSDDVTRLSSLWADLDVKPGHCPDFDAAHGIIDEVSACLGERPSVIVASGHGLHPYWPLDPESVAGMDTDAKKTLVARFGRLVKTVARHQSCGVPDSVFDLARMLRVPGTLNHKAIR